MDGDGVGGDFFFVKVWGGAFAIRIVRLYQYLREPKESIIAWHNAGRVTHASKFMPWKIESYIALPVVLA